MKKFDELINEIRKASSLDIDEGKPGKKSANEGINMMMDYDAPEDEEMEEDPEDEEMEEDPEDEEMEEDPEDEEMHGNAGYKKMAAKSMNVTLEDGSQFEAIDASEIVSGLKKSNAILKKSFSDTAKSSMDLFKAMSDKIRSLEAKIEELGTRGAGRKSVLLQKGERKTENAPTAAQMIVKATSAWREKKISNDELCMIERWTQRGQKIPEHILDRM